MEELNWLLTGGGLLIGTIGAACTFILPLIIIGVLVIFLIRRGNKSKAYREAAQNWPTTTGEVISSRVTVRRSGNSRTEHPSVVYTYSVNGQAFTGQIVRAGDQFGATRIIGDAQRIVERYSPGSRVTVFYNPLNPSEACLER